MDQVRRLICLVCIAPLAVACGTNPGSTATASPTTLPSVLLVFTKWVPDANGGSGPEPGYKPALTDLTGHDISKASAELDGTGLNWVVNVSFTPRGRELFRQLTHDGVSACPGPNQNCPQRHLTSWVDLSQTDINSWSDPTYAAKVSQPYDLGCLAHKTTTVVCPKLLTDALILEEITGGTIAIGAGLTKQSANELANSIKPIAPA